jgi:serine/threonine-protein kinase RsbW
MQASRVFPGKGTVVEAGLEKRDVSLTIPARPEFVVLARLALSAVCRLTPLSADEVADLKLAITEAANDYLDERGQAERLAFAFQLLDDQLVIELSGSLAEVAFGEQELGRAIIDATVDECDFSGSRTRLVKLLGGAQPA